MDLLGLARRQEQLKRITEIARVLGHYGLADWIQNIPGEEVRNLLASPAMQAMAGRPWEERVRMALTDLGGTFVKFGQILSTRRDLVGPDLAHELQMLQARTTPDPPDVVQRIIEAELGKPLQEMFAEFELCPMASASIGQVHRARLPNGEVVVVKVQHDGIEAKVRSDLDLLRALAEIIQNHVPAARPYQPVATVATFSRTLLRELDFSMERRNLQEFTRNFQGDPTVHIPRPFPDWCSRRVVTMEMLHGIPGCNQEELERSQADLNEFAYRSARMYMNMIFRDGFYHADPHPGNYMLLPGTVVGVLDCGMVGRIDDILRETFEDLLICISQGDAEGVTDVLLRIGSAPLNINRGVFRADISEFLAEYASLPMKDLDLGTALEQLTAIIRQHHLILPSGVSLLLKTIIMLDGTGRQLSPNFSLMELIAPMQGQMLCNRLKPSRWMAKWRRTYRDLDRLVTRAPRDLADLLEQLRAGQLEIGHRHRHLLKATNRLVLGMLTAALFLGSTQLCAMVVPPAVYGLSVPGVIGCTMAVILGVRLIQTLGDKEG